LLNASSPRLPVRRRKKNSPPVDTVALGAILHRKVFSWRRTTEAAGESSLDGEGIDAGALRQRR
jgi:hypothetical protein